jgi:chitin-binding protein
MSYSALLRRPMVYRVLAVAATALFLLTTALVDVASAHGSAIGPASRNYGCWQRWGSDFQNPRMATEDPMCWQAWQADSTAMWNWNGLYREGVAGNHQGAIPDGQLCSGGQTGGMRYAALDNPGAWRAANVSNTFTWTMHDQAQHGADYIRIYVTRQGFNPLTQRLRWSDLELRTEVPRILPGAGQPSTDPVLNGRSYSATVSAPGRTGRHIVYAIWQASHSDQSYYFCSDVIFPGGSGGGTTPTTPAPQPTTPAPQPTTPGPQPTTPGPQPTTPAPPASGACSATYSIVGSWSGGFQADVRVTAGSSAIRGWTVRWTFPSGQSVGNAWNATVTTSGSSVTATNAGHNGSLGAGQTANFGFIGANSGSAAPAVPAVTCAAA